MFNLLHQVYLRFVVNVAAKEKEMLDIKLLVLDVDGTLTDGKIHIGTNGEIFKSFHVKDGFAISQMLPFANITPMILTGRKSEIVEERMKELNVTQILQGVTNKAETLQKIAKKTNIAFEQIAYIGDELNDYEAMSLCGFKACPFDAVNEIRTLSDYISRFNGGHGAVRDIIEHLLRSDDKWENFLIKMNKNGK